VFGTDNSGQFTSASFAEYFAGQGVEWHHSAPHTPQQNSVVEQRNQSVVAMAHALLKQRGMLAIYWAEAVSIAVFLKGPTLGLEGGVNRPCSNFPENLGRKSSGAG
jgi:transposase InsO family protein